MAAESKKLSNYFLSLDAELKKAYKIASAARKKGLDPEDKVDVPLARNMAQRVEGLVSDMIPQLVNTGMTKRIGELEKAYSKLDWRVALKIAEEVAKGKFCKFKDKKEAMEAGIRTGFSYMTQGIVSAPLEGFIGLEIKKRRDSKGQYLSACYAGPIRGAGGTGAAFSIVLTDYIRSVMGYSRYDPSEHEIKRFVSEIYDYHERVTNLQYLPTPEEIEFLSQKLPVEVSGDPTEEIEVSNYKDLPRVKTNRIRGGMCLVMAEGLAQKAPKLWKRLVKWGKEYGLDWSFLEAFLILQKKIKAKSDKTVEGETKITPNYTFIKDIVAGRPVLTHPMALGGFRLRYGRNRLSGFSAASIHPNTMRVLNSYIATGTQLKIERPGKGAALTPCDTIEPPIVKLNDGSVIKLDSEQKLRDNKKKIKEILFLGDILFNYGDFSENGQRLAPAGYCKEWWVQELEKSIVTTFGSLDLEKTSGFAGVETKVVQDVIDHPLTHNIGSKQAFAISTKMGLPLHPLHTYYWNSIQIKQLGSLLNWFSKANLVDEKATNIKLILPLDREPKRILELVGVPHLVVSSEYIVILGEALMSLLFNLGFESGIAVKAAIEKVAKLDGNQKTINAINLLANVKVNDLCGTFVGARMGRPEKAKMRKLTGNPQVLFPVGDQGGRLRSFQAAMETGKIKADFPLFRCDKCNKDTIYKTCEHCGKKAKPKFFCPICGIIDSETCPKHGKTKTHARQEIDIKYYFNSALGKLGMNTYPDLIKGVRGTSNKDHIPENLTKGILRAKHSVYVNKDGTTRYDMSELPITHFKPKEIGTPLDRLKQLGYTHDINNKPLIDVEQILEIFPQDVILPSGTQTTDESADVVLLRVAAL